MYQAEAIWSWKKKRRCHGTLAYRLALGAKQWFRVDERAGGPRRAKRSRGGVDPAPPPPNPVPLQPQAASRRARKVEGARAALLGAMPLQPRAARR